MYVRAGRPAFARPYVCVGGGAISILIRFYNNFPPKNVIDKTSFSRVEIIIRQF